MDSELPSENPFTIPLGFFLEAVFVEIDVPLAGLGPDTLPVRLSLKLTSI